MGPTMLDFWKGCFRNENKFWRETPSPTFHFPYITMIVKFNAPYKDTLAIVLSTPNFAKLNDIRAFVGRIYVIISVFNNCTFALIERMW